jgi:hypothetical protein
MKFLLRDRNPSVVEAWEAQFAQAPDVVLCPGLATAVGRMDPKVCAVQMHDAYGTSHLGQVWKPLTLGQAKDVHLRMID